MLVYLDGASRALVLIFAGVLGAVLGSGLNCLAYRMAQGKSWAGGRSACPHCGHTLSFSDMVPVFSYLVLRGKCRYCGEKISPRYCITELLLGACYVLLLLRWDISPEFFSFAVLAACLLCLSLVDLDTFLIPDRFILIPGAVQLGVLVYEYGLTGALLKKLAFPAAVLAALLGFVLLMDKVLKKESMGGGDIKLLTVLALFFPFPQWLLLVFLAAVFGIVLALTLGAKRGTAFPFGPAISASAVVTSLVGGQLVGWYLGLF